LVGLVCFLNEVHKRVKRKATQGSEKKEAQGSKTRKRRERGEPSLRNNFGTLPRRTSKHAKNARKRFQ